MGSRKIKKVVNKNGKLLIIIILENILTFQYDECIKLLNDF